MALPDAVQQALADAGASESLATKELVETIEAAFRFAAVDDHDGFIAWLAERDEAQKAETAARVELQRAAAAAEQAAQQADAEKARTTRHGTSCSCRVTAEGKRVADIGCLPPEQRAFLLALIDVKRIADAVAA
jgi:hypothetical protein